MKKSAFRKGAGKFAILATAFFVFWIYLGSLINFHQHHIWGRNLIPNGILSKREETITVAQDLPSVDFLQSPDLNTQECEFLLKPQFSGQSLPEYCPQSFSISGIPAAHGLRGPPSVR
ncbi:hypothetical protein DSECCO2_309770 [anaerobic digester metagenome]|jgi:hypothetical protein